MRNFLFYSPANALKVRKHADFTGFGRFTGWIKVSQFGHARGKQNEEVPASTQLLLFPLIRIEAPMHAWVRQQHRNLPVNWRGFFVRIKPK
ncbi:MAG: hypothetical protein IPO49_08405 [Bacteroidetes bacterium]|nr:hypothetical protein [Bacteroidota bacterium]